MAERVDPECEAFLLVATSLDASFVNEDAACVAMATGRPAINGRYGNFPKSYEIRHHDIFDRDDHEARSRLEAALEEWLDVWDIDRSEVQWIEYEGLTRAATRPHRGR